MMCLGRTTVKWRRSKVATSAGYGALTGNKKRREGSKQLPQGGGTVGMGLDVGKYGGWRCQLWGWWVMAWLRSARWFRRP